MRRCSRPTCAEPADFVLGFDPVARVAWLAELTETSRAPILLCAEHAAELRLPAGWVGRDERGDEPALLLVLDEPEPETTPPPSPRRRPTRLEPEPDTLFAGDHDPAEHLGESLYGTEEPPVADDRDRAESPLLARAFRTAGLG